MVQSNIKTTKKMIMVQRKKITISTKEMIMVTKGRIMDLKKLSITIEKMKEKSTSILIPDKTRVIDTKRSMSIMMWRDDRKEKNSLNLN